ncbi:fungal-specific transcription factor domain-containing protein [Lipomyces kononenkoae]|uniref:Fungal-specific transcription factor domain-containing protein n=1 Tax=Lipomyces kononenkoae TaxID=34357 RepID=A0ACC3T5W9_LIPKO
MSTIPLESMPLSSSSTSPQLQPRTQPLTQPPPRHQQRKRSQVARACDWCRVHRIKCDSDHPCSNCKTRGGQCSNSRPIRATLPQAYRDLERLRQRVQELELELQKYRTSDKPVHWVQTLQSLISSTSADHDPGNSDPDLARGAGRRAGRVWEGIHISTARSPQKTWYGPSSLFYFIGQINTFLTSALEQTHSASRMLPNSASKLLDGPNSEEDQPGRLVAPAGDATHAGEYLTPTQEEYFLSLFWQSYHTSCPILDELGFKEHYQSLWATSDKERKPSALVDIVIALCMQYGMAQLPCARGGVSAASRDNVNNNDATIAGRWHYRRCQTLLAAELESPTISTLQCHILCSIYLCCGSFQNMADNACGLAVRTAYMLGLHLEPPQGMPRPERELRKRLWWTLYVLETKISMKLGRPFLLHDSSTTCSLPADDREIAMLSGSSFAPIEGNVTWLTWSLHNTKLLLAARTAYTNVYDRAPDAFNACNPQPITELLDEWLKGVPEALKTKRQDNGVPFSTDKSALEIEQFTPVWLQRQRLLLELMYHNLCTNLYRPSITFALARPPNSLADSTAMKCAAHAMALTRMMHQVLLSTSILAGWHEAFQWQWNATMTLVGFALAYPQGASTGAVRSAIDDSIAVFEQFGNSFAVAASAVMIMSDLSGKVDLVIEQSHRKQGAAQNVTALDKMQLVAPGYKESGNEWLLTGDFTAAQAINGPLSFDYQTTAEITGVLGQSIDIFSDAYNDFDWLGMNSNFPDRGL